MVINFSNHNRSDKLSVSDSRALPYSNYNISIL